MSTLPLTEAILLEIHQSLGGKTFQTNKKNKFATGQISLDAHNAMVEEVLQAIFEALDMAPEARMDAIDNLMEFADAYKSVELKAWTFAADQRQILWALLGQFFIPGLARRVAFWSLHGVLVDSVLDKGMPGGRFWYLPEARGEGGNASLYLPVAQVVDWLLDLLGMPIEQMADQRSEATDGVHESLRRSLYNWRNDMAIKPDSIQKYFPDDAELTFQGVFTSDMQSTPAEQFAAALAFVKRKGLTADMLRHEIPMTAPGRLEEILEGHANDDEKVVFVKNLAERYASPSMKTIRQRLLLARTVQDGYIRLLKFLCPDVERQCADPEQNKLLQIFNIYKLVYNLTIDAWHHCHDQGEAAENAWFETKLPPWYQNGLLLSILPSRRITANEEFAQFLTRRFFDMEAGAELENHVGWDEPSKLLIMERNLDRATRDFNEMRSVEDLVKRMKNSPHWRNLQQESSFWVIWQVAQHPSLGLKGKRVAMQRMRELANTPAQIVATICIELDSYLNGERNNRPKDTQTKVQSLLEEAEASEGFTQWKAPILQYKAKHMLASNDFEGAEKLFREALDAVLEHNFGTLRGKIAKDCLALAVANGKLIANNHEKYYREMLAGGMMAEYRNVEDIPPIEETARKAAEYFWETLYKPYPGVPPEKPRIFGVLDELFEGLIPLLMSGNQDGLSQWIRTNGALLKSPLPDVEGNSVLMGLIKMHTRLSSSLPLMRQMTPVELQNILLEYENMLKNWRQFFSQLVMESPKQLNIADLKGQTPLMLMAQAGNTELVQVMLKAGANPDLQDWHGMTALHAACKSRVNSCVDALLAHPCKLDKLTTDLHSPLHTACWSGHVHAVERISQLEPSLVWQRDSAKMTPLELAEFLKDNPDELKKLSEKRVQDGWDCASVEELEKIMLLLEEATSLS